MFHCDLTRDIIGNMLLRREREREREMKEGKTEIIRGFHNIIERNVVIQNIHKNTLMHHTALYATTNMQDTGWKMNQISIS